MQLKHQHVEAVVMAACVLHNVLRGRSPSLTDGDAEDPETHDVIPGTWQQDQTLADIPNIITGNRATAAAKRQRDILRDYFVSPEGSVPWQESKSKGM